MRALWENVGGRSLGSRAGHSRSRAACSLLSFGPGATARASTSHVPTSRLCPVCVFRRGGIIPRVSESRDYARGEKVEEFRDKPVFPGGFDSFIYFFCFPFFRNPLRGCFFAAFPRQFLDLISEDQPTHVRLSLARIFLLRENLGLPLVSFLRFTGALLLRLSSRLTRSAVRIRASSVVFTPATTVHTLCRIISRAVHSLLASWP